MNFAEWRKLKKGDKIASVLSPIARQLDQILDTDLEHCEDCERMKELLNQNASLWEATKKRLGIE